MGPRDFFKYAFGPDFKIAEPYIEEVKLAVPEVVCEAVKSASCAEFCNDSRFDPKRGILSKPTPADLRTSLCKSAAARAFGLDDAVTSVLEVMASGSEPSFGKSLSKKASEHDPKVVSKLAKAYAMYKLAAIRAVLDSPGSSSINDADAIFVAAAQDLTD